jgi:tripartite-type tricarboxylate transporter receptor subunit TctC
MKKRTFLTVTVVIGLFFILALSVSAGAQYPNRPITILAGFPAGGAVDTMARLLAQKVGDDLGQPLVVVNKPGGGGAIAATEVSRARADGYTLCFSVALSFAAWPHMTEARYTIDDFSYISAVGKFQEAFVSLPDKPWKDWKGLIDYAREKGGVSVGVMTPYDRQVLSYIALKDGVEFSMVPNRGGAEIMTQVLGGHVDFGFSGGIHYQYVRAGKMIVLAGHGRDRLVATPEVPTLKELGYDVALENYNVIVGPAGLPEEIVVRLARAFEKAVQSEDYQDLMNNKLNFPVVSLGSKVLTERIREMDADFKEMARYLAEKGK